jgi:hypothetical protein
MVRLTSYMKPRMQKTFSIFILGLMVAAGAGCSKKSVEPVGDVGDAAEQMGETVDQQAVEEVEEEIDTSGWEIYKSREFGYEIKTPPEWKRGETNVGPYHSNYDYYEEELKYKIGNDDWYNINTDLYVEVLKASLTLKELDNELTQSAVLENSFEDPKEITVNGLRALYRKSPVVLNTREETPAYLYNEEYLIKNGNTFYRICLSIVASTEDQLEMLMKQWKNVLESFTVVSTE